jgi:hypothetical protein
MAPLKKRWSSLPQYALNQFLLHSTALRDNVTVVSLILKEFSSSYRCFTYLGRTDELLCPHFYKNHLLHKSGLVLNLKFYYPLFPIMYDNLKLDMLEAVIFCEMWTPIYSEVSQFRTNLSCLHFQSSTMVTEDGFHQKRQYLFTLDWVTSQNTAIY